MAMVVSRTNLGFGIVIPWPVPLIPHGADYFDTVTFERIRIFKTTIKRIEIPGEFACEQTAKKTLFFGFKRHLDQYRPERVIFGQRKFKLKHRATCRNLDDLFNNHNITIAGKPVNGNG